LSAPEGTDAIDALANTPLRISSTVSAHILGWPASILIRVEPLIS